MAFLTEHDAMDIIDAYGPEADFWPDNMRSSIEDLMDGSDSFREYVADSKRIEDMLANWDEQDDGAAIDLDDIFGGDDEPEDDYDGGDHHDDDEPEDDDYQGATQPKSGAAPNSSPPPPEEDEDEPEQDSADETEDEAPHILELDLENMKLEDMEEALANVIRKEFEGDKDFQYGVFTRDYDKLVELNPPPSTSIAEIDTHVASSVGPLMKDLRRLIAARSQVKRTPGMRRGRLHAPNLHRILAGDDRVFTRREEAASLDTAISLVIDCSGSMSGDRLLLAAQTAYALGAVLNKLGIAFECLGFTTFWGNAAPAETRTKEYAQEAAQANAIKPIHRAEAIAMPKFKAFDERWNSGVQRRFAYIHNQRGGKLDPVFEMGMTPEGCGNEFAARRLLGRKEARKIMITMTDGEPGIQNMTYHSGADRIHAERMVQAIAAAGIDIIGVGISHQGPTQYYPNSMVINSVSEMPVKLLGLLKTLLLGK